MAMNPRNNDTDPEPDEIILPGRNLSKISKPTQHTLLQSDDEEDDPKSAGPKDDHPYEYDSDDLVMRHSPFGSASESEHGAAEPDFIDLDDDADQEQVAVETEEVQLDLSTISIPVQSVQDLIKELEIELEFEEEKDREIIVEGGFKFGGEIPDGAYLGFTTADGEKLEVEPCPPKYLDFFANPPENDPPHKIKCLDQESSESKRNTHCLLDTSAVNDNFLEVDNEEFVFGGDIPEGAYLGFTTADGEQIEVDPCPPKYLDIFADSLEENTALVSVAIESSQIARKSSLRKKPITCGFTSANGENLYTLTKEELKKAQEWGRRLELEVAKSFNSYFAEKSCENNGILSDEFLERLLAHEQRKKGQNKSQMYLQMRPPLMKNPTKVSDGQPSFTQEVTSAVEAVLQDTQFLMSQVGDRHSNYLTNRDLLIAEKKRHHQTMVNNFRRAMLRSKLTDPVKRQRLEMIERLRLSGSAEKPEELRKPFKSEFIEMKSQPRRVSLRDTFPWTNSVITAELDLDFDAIVNFQFNAMAFLTNDIIIGYFKGGIPIGHFLVPMSEAFYVGRGELEMAFLSAKGIDPKLISSQWFANAYKLILWKLISMEHRLPEERKDEILTIANVLNELHYRYYMEIDLSKRSCLRECLEMDAFPGHLMVLLVEEARDDGRVILCDGQYSVKATIDAFLQRQIEKGRLRRGVKVIVDSAEFINLDQGYAPLEVPENVVLRIHGNSTRRCRWDTRLGRYHRQPKLKVSLQSLDPLGGVVSGVDLLVVRKYPLLYVSGDRHRNERMQSVYKREMLNKMDRERAAEEEERNTLKELPFFSSITEIDAIEDLHDILQSKKYGHLEEQLSESQRRELEKYRAKLMQDRDEVIRQRMMTENLKSHSVLMRVKVTDLHSPSLEKCAELWIWNPVGDSDLDVVDGAAIYVENVVATGTRNNILQLKSGRAFACKILQPRKFNSVIETIHRRLTKLSTITDISTFAPVFLEYDVVVILLPVSARVTEKFQHVFATDDQLNLICLNFWNGAERFCCQDLLVPGQVIALSNLQWRSRSNYYAIPNGYITELTVLTRNPRGAIMIREMERLQEFLEESPYEKVMEDIYIKYPFMKNIHNGSGSISRTNTSSLTSSSDIQTPHFVKPG